MGDREKYMLAYRWCRMVQCACLLNPLTVEVKTGYCAANLSEKNIDAWTASVWIWCEDTKKWIYAEWKAWAQERFEEEKKEIINYLKQKGIEL